MVNIHEIESPSLKSGFSEPIDIGRLERESRRLFAAGFILGIALYAIIAAFMKTETHPKRAISTRVETRITTDLVMLPPRQRVPFIVTPHPFRKKEYRADTFRMRAPDIPAPSKQPSLPSAAEPSFRFREEPAAFPDELPDIADTPDTGIARPEPPVSDIPAGRKDPRDFSFREEMISTDDYIPQARERMKGFVFANPRDKFAITGVIPFTHLFNASYPTFTLSPGIEFLGEGLKKFTGIVPVMTKSMYLYHYKNFRFPFLYIACSGQWRYYPFECERIRDYMLEGGFVVFENLKPWEETSPAEMSLKQFVRDTFGSRARIAIIPNDHPLYHCFFNFPDGPPIGSEYKIINGRVYFRNIPYLEGIWIRDRLAGIFSNKGYGLLWNEPDKGDAPLKMSVNMVVYALMQDGGKAEKRFDAELKPVIAVKRWLSAESPTVLSKIKKPKPGDPGMHIKNGQSGGSGW